MWSIGVEWSQTLEWIQLGLTQTNIAIFYRIPGYLRCGFRFLIIIDRINYCCYRNKELRTSAGMNV